MSVMVMAAFNTPPAAGAKWPWMVQLAPAARLVPQLLANSNEEAFVPVTAMLVMERAVVPVLVMVTDCELLAEPTVVVGKVRLVAERVTGGWTPVPLSAMVCGELEALSVMVMAAVSAPVVVGPKWPWMEQLAPAAREEPQEFTNTNEEAFVPVSAMLVMASGVAPVLVRTMYLEALAVPTCWLPKASLVAESDTWGPSPVPVSEMLCVAYPGPEARRELSVTAIDPVRVPSAVGEKPMASKQEAPASRRFVPFAPAGTSGQEEDTLESSVKFAATLGLVPVMGMGKNMGTLPMLMSAT